MIRRKEKVSHRREDCNLTQEPYSGLAASAKLYTPLRGIIPKYAHLRYEMRFARGESFALLTLWNGKVSSRAQSNFIHFPHFPSLSFIDPRDNNVGKNHGYNRRAYANSRFTRKWAREGKSGLIGPITRVCYIPVNYDRRRLQSRLE